MCLKGLVLKNKTTILVAEMELAYFIYSIDELKKGQIELMNDDRYGNLTK